MNQTFSARLDADIAAVGLPPATDDQIAETLASLPIPRTDPPLLCRYCNGPVGHTDWCPVCEKRAPAIPRTDPVQEARDRLRAIARIAHDVERELRACECANPELPNGGTAIGLEAALALESLAEVGR